MDASVIDVSLSVFTWAGLGSEKGVVQAHVDLAHSAMLPAFMAVTERRCREIQTVRDSDLPVASILVVNRECNDF